jgi:signal transduction histidine kinase
MESKSPLISRHPPLWGSVLGCILLVALMAWLRLSVYGHVALPIGYGVPIVLVVWTRRRSLLWLLVVVFTAMTIWKFLFLLRASEVPAVEPLEARLVSVSMVLGDLLLVAYVCDLLMRHQNAIEKRTGELLGRNEELSQRREEIARQNEELQSQTEELERQGEELRVANDELAVRQRTLEAMLDLSRSLTPDMPRDRVFTLICQTMQRLIPVSTGAAIWERAGDRLRLVCHHGFGALGPDLLEAETRGAFASMIIEHGRTGYLEDVSLRPDLRIPQPREGDRFKAVLAAPLRVSSQTLGTLEVYSSDHRGWTDEEVALVESLAAQASTSIAAADLFAQIENNHARLQTILNTVPFGIAIISAGAQRMTLNPAGASLLKMPLELSAGQIANPVERIFRAGVEILDEARPTARALRGEITSLEELESRFDDGRSITTLTSAAPIRDRSGTIVAAVIAFVDISAQKNLQAELDNRRREAEEASVRKSRFLAAVSHDIRTPANAISLLAELIQRSAIDPSHSSEIPELAQELQRSSINLVNLISDVLDLTRLDSGRVDLHDSEFDFNQWLSDECKQLSPLAEQKKLQFSCSPPEAPIHLRADRIKLSRIVTNLIGNAIKFTETGSVHVEARLLPDRRAQIEVRDTGIGIAQEHMPRIFDEFFQLKNPERDRNKGSGLGLSISKRLLEVMGGELKADSTHGKGSTFTVILPASIVVG